MAPREATAKSLPRKQTLSKNEACKLLQVAPSADTDLITQAYWLQARKVRVHASTNPAARQRLDDLNSAYRILHPAGGEAPLESETPADPHEANIAETFTSWLGGIIEQTAARWPGRATEVAVLTGTTVILTGLALGAGAAPLWTVLAAGIAGLTIWAPWRRT